MKWVAKLPGIFRQTEQLAVKLQPHLRQYREISGDRVALEALGWLVEKGDTNADMWKHRLSDEISEEIKLKE